jgi:hypothetical protein
MYKQLREQIKEAREQRNYSLAEKLEVQLFELEEQEVIKEEKPLENMTKKEIALLIRKLVEQVGTDKIGGQHNYCYGLHRTLEYTYQSTSKQTLIKNYNQMKERYL